jgi:hypothetical protein
MAISTTLVGSGQHHAVATGNVTVGAGYGEVAAAVADSLITFLLPFSPKIFAMPGFEDQLYVTSKSLDGNSTDVRLDATPITYGASGPVLRLRIDLTAVPAEIYIQIEANHSTGR